ncbi:MAG: hypothetical protein ACO3E4_07560, partial [Candidatus Nanopelagicaceae bacterium]
ANKDIAKLGKQFDAFAKKSVKAFGIAAAAAGALAVKLGTDAVKGAMEDQKAQIALATALRNTVNANDEVIASTVKYLDKLELQVGVNNSELIPSLQKFAQATGSVEKAQALQALALDVSAGTTKSLITVTDGIVRAIGGNIGALKRLGIPLDEAIIKNKDLGGALEALSKTFAGQASARANTFEFRMLRLRFAFDQALDSLGYALIPALEEFVGILSKDVLPKIAMWIEMNKKQLAEGLKTAANAALELLKQAIKIGAWFVANFDTIKNFAILLASIWATGRVIAFATAVGKVALAFQGMQIAAAGAAGASAAATGAGAAAGAGRLATLGLGAKVLSIAAIPLAAIAAAGFFVRKEGNKIRAQRAKVEAGLAGYQGAPGPSDLAGLTGGKKSKVKVDKSLQTYLDFLNKIDKVENKAAKTKKELTKRQEDYNKLLADMGIKTTEQQSAITQFAIRENLLKQAAITGSPLTSIGSPTPMNMKTAGNPIIVNVQGSVISERDLVSMIADRLGERTLAGNPVTGTYLGSNTD